MAISSVFRFGLEKNIGAMELVTYGPADVTSYFLAFLIRNIFFTLIYCAVLLGFFSLTALLNNLVLGPQFFYGLLMAVFLSVAVYAYGSLTSTLVDNASVGTAVFGGILVFLILIQMGSFTIASGYVRSLSSVISSLVQWVSPLFYWSQGFSMVEYGNVGGYLLNLIFLIGLSLVLVLASHFAAKSRGVRE